MAKVKLKGKPLRPPQLLEAKHTFFSFALSLLAFLRSDPDGPCRESTPAACLRARRGREERKSKE